MGDAPVRVNAIAMVRLTLLCHAATSATRRAAFPVGEPLEAKGRAAAAALAGDLPRFDRVLAGPDLAARETAACFGLTPAVDHDLREPDFGRWAGRSLVEIAAEEPESLDLWLRDATAAPHGGETITALLDRVRHFLAAQKPLDGRVLAVTGQAVIRAALLAALEAPPPAFWQIDVAPLSSLTIHGNGRAWRVTRLGPGIS